MVLNRRSMNQSIKRMTVRSLGVFLIALAVAIAIGIWQLNLVGDFRVDDAYISLSFSKNLAHGNGLVFSVAERVEGYSNFLWVVILSIPYAFGAEDAYPFARVLGVSTIFLLAWVTYRFARRHAGSFVALAAPLIVLSSSDLFRAEQSALETVPYTMALTTGFFLYLREHLEPLTRRRRYSLWAFLAAALIRIDGMVPLSFILAFEVLFSLFARRFSVYAFLRWAAIPLGIYLIYFLWRWHYYGLLLPSTYYAKSLANSDPQRGIGYAFGVVRDWGLVYWAPFVSLSFWRWRRLGGPLVLGFLCGIIAYVIHVGGDWMPFQRFWLPYLPLAAVFVTWGFANAWALTASLPKYARAHVLAGILGALAFSVTHLCAASIDSPEEDGKVRFAAQVLQHTKVELKDDARFLRAIIRRPGERLATDYPGLFSVDTDAQIIDMWGLCNAMIARRGDSAGISPIYGKSCPLCYASFDTDYFHTFVPLIRTRNTFVSLNDVIQNVFHGPAIDSVIGLHTNFVAGRVTETSTSRTLWFLERRRPGRDFSLRLEPNGMRVDYPFGH